MQFTLTESMFTNGSYTVQYGVKQATFTIIDESYSGASGVVVDVNRMLCTIRTYDEAGEKESEVFGSLTIGLGDTNVAVTTEDTTILGKLMTRDNMSLCVVELYE